MVGGMAQPRLAARAPVACAACYGQYPDRAHIDFASAIEGGPVDSNPRSPRVSWVVICENCLRNAVKMLPDAVDIREQHEREVAALKERAEAAESYADDLEDTLSRRPSREGPAAPKTHKPSGAPRRGRYQPKGDS